MRFNTPDASGIVHISYKFLNSSLAPVDPPAAAKSAIEAGIADWNRYSGTTKVKFEPGISGVPADLEIIGRSDESNTYDCVAYDPNTTSINYGPAFILRAQNSTSAGATTIAHELGHFLGLGEAGTNPPTPTIMNNPVVGPNTTCQNATVPTTTVQQSDATKAACCARQICPTPTPTPEPVVCNTSDRDFCERSLQGTWTGAPYCNCDLGPQRDPCPGSGRAYEECMSPILIDVAGNGFDLTDVHGGVAFDLNGDSITEDVSWTAAGSDDAWLVLDRNGNGRIDNGRELFGNHTAQIASNSPNGFLALAEYDRVERGGNSDGVINRDDAIFTSLRLWQDINHNGVSEAAELHPLLELVIASVAYDYKVSKRVDEYGNRFWYRAKVKDERGAQAGRWAWDVFLLRIKQ